MTTHLLFFVMDVSFISWLCNSFFFYIARKSDLERACHHGDQTSQAEQTYVPGFRYDPSGQRRKAGQLLRCSEHNSFTWYGYICTTKTTLMDSFMECLTHVWPLLPSLLECQDRSAFGALHRGIRGALHRANKGILQDGEQYQIVQLLYFSVHEVCNGEASPGRCPQQSILSSNFSRTCKDQCSLHGLQERTLNGILTGVQLMVDSTDF